MLNGKLKSHDELWQALLEAEKLFATKDPQVLLCTCTACTPSQCLQHIVTDNAAEGVQKGAIL